MLLLRNLTQVGEEKLAKRNIFCAQTWNVITIFRGISESMGSSPIDGALAQLGGCVQGTVPALYANLGLCNGSKTRPRVAILKH